MEEKRFKISKLNSVLYLILLTFAAFSAIFSGLIASWYRNNFGNLKIQNLIFTLSHPLNGANYEFLFSTKQYIAGALTATLGVCLISSFLDSFIKKRNAPVTLKFGPLYETTDALAIYRTCALAAALYALGFMVLTTWKEFGVSEYFAALRETTSVYEEEYAEPTPDAVTAGGATKNLICIYMESMETTYASKEVGGAQEEYNYIPGLTRLADENISFSDKDDGLLGGFHSVTGTTWTMGALFATTAGLPFAFPGGRNKMNRYASFASGTVALGNLLADKGYQQEFLCGSDGDFAGRKTYFQEHGGYEVFDLFTAREKHYIPEDYSVWWGFEDSVLYRIAKDEALRLAANQEPFNLTLLTVDTHQVGGYVCDLCGDSYPEPLANVIACADRQVCDFVRWCQEQDFYQDTVIVILGDHPRMDTILVGGVSYYDRTVYNCFINAEHTEGASLRNREFTAMDMFPTILSAMGFEIENDRLGLGVNLFSKQETLCERMSFAALDKECSKYSEYYVRRFS